MTMKSSEALKWLNENFNYVDSVTIIDANGTIIAKQRFNPRYTDEENETDNRWALGKNLLEVFPSQDPQTSELLTALKRDGVIHRRQDVTYNHQGKKTVTNHLTFPIVCRGRFLGSVQISRDVTNLDTSRVRSSDEAHPAGNAKFTLEDIVGRSSEMRQIKSVIARIADSDSSVLVYGDTGTGKELVVSAIHNASYRKNKNFIPINCAALPESILEGLLFGSRKGAFTGAENMKGLFEECDGGTIYLDEINSMPLNLQAKLLRVLQDKAVLPLGETHPRPVDVRIIASVNKPVKQLIQDKEMREDLIYRLNAINIQLPPLRSRQGDIRLLAEHFVDKYSRLLGKHTDGISSEALVLLQAYHWPGNVRELEHTIESAINLAEDFRPLQVDDLPSYLIIREAEHPDFVYGELEPISLLDAVSAYEKRLISDMLVRTGGNVAKAARLLGVPRTTLYSKMETLGIR